ncbi:MAG TPA: DUF4350 domain-containing protein [Pseudomonadales bacterium]
MNDRLVTAGGAALALLLVLGLLFPRPGVQVSRPTSVETGPNGYAGLVRWLEAAAIPVRSLQTRVDGLEQMALPAEGNLLITTMPHRHRMRPDEVTRIIEWVARGNTLLVMAALDDTPVWSLIVDTSHFLEDLEQLTGVPVGLPEQAQRRRIGTPNAPSTVALEGLPGHPLSDGVRRLEGESDWIADVWQAWPDGHQAVLRLAREPVTGLGAIWQVEWGEGHAIVAAVGSLFTNRALGLADNRRLVANLTARHLGTGGAVIFDDMHQGLSAGYDADALFRDPRLWATSAFVIGFWALYLIGSSDRLVAPLAPRPRPDQMSFVAALGGFLARKLSPSRAGRLMVTRWLEELRGRGLIPPDGSPWPALDALAALDGAAVARLRRLHEAIDEARWRDLLTLHDTLEELRRMLK